MSPDQKERHARVRTTTNDMFFLQNIVCLSDKAEHTLEGRTASKPNLLRPEHGMSYRENKQTKSYRETLKVTYLQGTGFFFCSELRKKGEEV